VILVSKLVSSDKEIIFYIILQVTQLFEGKRTLTGVIRLLQGSYAKQTIQDAYFFKSTHLYGIFHEVINSIELKELYKELEDQEMIIIRHDMLKLTPKGLEQLSQLKEKLSTLNESESNHSKFLLNKDTKKKFWYKLVLIIQTISHLARGKRRFIPIISDLSTQISVKKLLVPYDNKKIMTLTGNFYNEINQLRNNLSLLEQQILLYRLSGFHRTALSWRQISEKTGLTVIEVKLRFNILMYKLFVLLINNPSRYPYLTQLSDIKSKKKHLSNSSQITWNELKNGLTLQEIAVRRKLTEGTIYDHLIEIILVTKSINIEKYINGWKIELIKDLYQKNRFKTLSEYKCHLPNEVNYNDIRITLAHITSLERI